MYTDSIQNQDIQDAFSDLVLSASGWRKVFATSKDEEDTTTCIGQANQVLVAHMAHVFADYIISKYPTTKKRILVLGMDTRPTGLIIAQIMGQVFISKGLNLKYIGISAAPEIMCFARKFCGFAYISASHNPIGYNGVKFGLNDGGVLPGEEANLLIESFKKSCLRIDAIEKAKNLLAACPQELYKKTLENSAKEKQNALNAYKQFSYEVISAETNPKKQNYFFDSFKHAIEKDTDKGNPSSIVIDFNGSARTTSIDRSFFEELGINVFGINEKPGQIAHRIVPEGQSLSYCAHEIERLRLKGSCPEEKNVILGYMPDCDGDRGNIVYWDDKQNKACILEAQEVFALSTIAELSHLVFSKKIQLVKTDSKVNKKVKASPPTAVVVNGPTSMRIESIAHYFGIEVERAEVGEANVVNRARELRKKGYIVRILGEGSNGGNITHPAAVRDPLNTVFSLLKLLLLKGNQEKKGLFHLWCTLSDQEHLYKENFSIADIISTVPKYITTSAYEPEAILNIKSKNHSILKQRFQSIFLKEWEEKKHVLKQTLDLVSWQAISYNGTKQFQNISDFGISNKGGLKILFSNNQEEVLAFMWMRGSGTEPVFRILCDVKGGNISHERNLLAWLTKMVLEADKNK